MKRKDMILVVSLDLFNHLGQSNVTSVDIANELDISPGNLYYHFKGKEEIINALVQRFAMEIDTLLATVKQMDSNLLVRWVMIYFFMEAVYRNRFFFRGIADISYNFPDAGKQLSRILDQLREMFTSSLVMLAENEEINISPVQKNLIAKLVKSIMLVVIYWESYLLLNRQTMSENEFIQDASLQILSVISPYLNEDQIRDIHQLHQQYLRDKIVSPVLGKNTTS